MDSIWDLANPHLRDLALYEPGKPIEETARDCRSARRRNRQARLERKSARPFAAGRGRRCRRPLRVRIFIRMAAVSICAQRSGEKLECRARKHCARQRLERDHRVHRARFSPARDRNGDLRKCFRRLPAGRFPLRRPGQSTVPDRDHRFDLEAILAGDHPADPARLHRQSQQSDRAHSSDRKPSTISWRACLTTSWSFSTRLISNIWTIRPDTLQFVRARPQCDRSAHFFENPRARQPAAWLRHRAAGIDPGVAKNARAFQHQRHRPGRRDRSPGR